MTTILPYLWRELGHLESYPLIVKVSDALEALNMDIEEFSEHMYLLDMEGYIEPYDTRSGLVHGFEFTKKAKKWIENRPPDDEI